jgi:hypothetical protein
LTVSTSVGIKSTPLELDVNVAPSSVGPFAQLDQAIERQYGQQEQRGQQSANNPPNQVRFSK